MASTDRINLILFTKKPRLCNFRRMMSGWLTTTARTRWRQCSSRDVELHGGIIKRHNFKSIHHQFGSCVNIHTEFNIRSISVKSEFNFILPLPRFHISRLNILNAFQASVSHDFQPLAPGPLRSAATPDNAIRSRRKRGVRTIQQVTTLRSRTHGPSKPLAYVCT